MDEPSTGLDTISRNDLWNVIKRAKKECTIILTSSQFPSYYPDLQLLAIINRMLQESAFKQLNYLTRDILAHSMEEAEELCDRVGIFVSGNFQCLGTPKEVCTL